MTADLDALRAERDRYKAGLERIVGEWQRRHEAWHPDVRKNEWSNGHHTGIAHCSIIAREVLNTDAENAEQDQSSFIATQGTDREWFELTGNCGHCGNPGEDCICTPDDPCRCGTAHEPRRWPKPCTWCKGTGVNNPLERAS